MEEGIRHFKSLNRRGAYDLKILRVETGIEEVDLLVKQNAKKKKIKKIIKYSIWALVILFLYLKR